ncbi:MAG: type II secretion system F family protein [Phycisphaerae bacterium]|nr:type II secretion system F family protein [Phycisphaerae bacterium]
MGYSNQLITVYHNLATMLNAGLPILRSMDRAAEYAKGSLKRTLIHVLNALSQEGKTVHEAMDEHPRVFREFDRTVIKAADQSGNLEACFKMLSEWYEFQRRMRRIVFRGLTYPVFIIHAAAFVIQLPGLILGTIPPLQCILNIALFLGTFFYLPLFLIWLIFWQGGKIPVLRKIVDGITLRIPLLGKGMRELCISRFCKAFGMLFKAGIPMSECFDLAPQATGNYWVSRMFSKGRDMIAEGRMPSEGFSRHLPTEYIDLWTIGEESGDMDRCVDKIAEISADRADLRISMFARALPWFIYLIYMGVMVYLVLQLAQSAYQNLDVGF